VALLWSPSSSGSVSALFPTCLLGWGHCWWPVYLAVGQVVPWHGFLPFCWAGVIVIGLHTQQWVGFCFCTVSFPSAGLGWLSLASIPSGGCGSVPAQFPALLLSWGHHCWPVCPVVGWALPLCRSLPLCWVHVAMVGIHTQRRAGGHPCVCCSLSTGLTWLSFMSIPSNWHGIVFVCPTPLLGLHSHWHPHPAASWVSSLHVLLHLCWACMVIDRICTQQRAGCYPCEAPSPAAGLASLSLAIQPSSGLGFVSMRAFLYWKEHHAEHHQRMVAIPRAHVPCQTSPINPRLLLLER